VSVARTELTAIAEPLVKSVGSLSPELDDVEP
jgi:hypothetical protein